MLGGKGVTLSELLLVIAIFIITFILLTPLVNKMKDRGNDIKCSNNISMISLALHMYAADHDEAFPQALSALYPGYIKDEKVFDCPTSKPMGTPDKCDYEYVSSLSESSPSTDVIVYDRDLNHKNRGRNIVRVSGSVEWVGSVQGRPK